MAQKYKVGDKVQIKSLDWYNENKDKVGNILYKRDGSAYPVFFSKYMSKFCGEILTIKSVFNHSYHMNETSSCEFWTDEMIEGLVEEEAKPNIIEEAKTYWDGIKDAWICPEGYQFVNENGNVINATKIVLEKKKDTLQLESIKMVREYWSEHARIFIEIYPDNTNECIFTHLWVVDGHRRKGYGKQALMQAESIAKGLGCYKVYLKVETDSWMHKWYLRSGYKLHGLADEGYTWLTKNLN